MSFVSSNQQKATYLILHPETQNGQQSQEQRVSIRVLYTPRRKTFHYQPPSSPKSQEVAKAAAAVVVPTHHHPQPLRLLSAPLCSSPQAIPSPGWSPSFRECVESNRIVVLPSARQSVQPSRTEIVAEKKRRSKQQVKNKSSHKHIAGHRQNAN